MENVDVRFLWNIFFIPESSPSNSVLMAPYFSSLVSYSASNLNTLRICRVHITNYYWSLERLALTSSPPVASSRVIMWVYWSSSSTRSSSSAMLGLSLKPSFLTWNMTSIMYWVLLSRVLSCRTCLSLSNIACIPRGDTCKYNNNCIIIKYNINQLYIN